MSTNFWPCHQNSLPINSETKPQPLTDNTLCSLGRTHRSNQVTAPEYIFLISELAGERRFASIVAKRLESLVRLWHANSYFFWLQMFINTVFNMNNGPFVCYAYNGALLEWDMFQLGMCPKPKSEFGKAQSNGFYGASKGTWLGLLR